MSFQTELVENEARDEGGVDAGHRRCLGRREDAAIDAAEDMNGMPSAQTPRTVACQKCARLKAVPAPILLRQANHIT